MQGEVDEDVDAVVADPLGDLGIAHADDAQPAVGPGFQLLGDGIGRADVGVGEEVGVAAVAMGEERAEERVRRGAAERSGDTNPTLSLRSGLRSLWWGWICAASGAANRAAQRRCSARSVWAS